MLRSPSINLRRFSSDKTVMMNTLKGPQYFLVQAKVLQQSGQAALEYILLMFVIISLVTGFILNISEATQRFTQNYFGSYLECLLQTGELPRLGSDTVPDTECDDLYQPFTLAGGRPPIDSSGDGSGVSGGDSQNSDNSTKDNDSANNVDSNGKDPNGSDKADSAASSSSGGGADGAGSELGSSGSGRKSRVPVNISGDKKIDSDKANTLKGTNNFASSGEEESESSGRTNYIPIYGANYLTEEKEEGSDVIVAGTVDVSEQSESLKTIPIAIKKNREVQSEKEEELGFGDYLRYLVIGIIILVIIIVVGGQLFQFQKSSE